MYQFENAAHNGKHHMLIYSTYWLPDVAATGQHLAEVAAGLLESFEITVICGVPSYTGVISDYYKKNKFYFENINGVNIIRVRVPEFNKMNKLSRIKNILAYFFRAMQATRKVKNVDYVLTISNPPILGGLLGVWGKWRTHSLMIYSQADLCPEQIVAINYTKNKLITNLMMALDKFSCKQSDLIITVGRDLVTTLENRFKKGTGKVPKIVLINSGINEKEIYPLAPENEKVIEFKKKYGLFGKFVIMYSGNIGLYYDLENLIKVIEKIKPGVKTPDGRDVCFAFVGAGAVLTKLVEYKQQHNMDNVVFIPYQNKDDLIYCLNSGDVHWCVNAKGIKGVSCPSKYYGIAAVGRPVLAVLECGSEIQCIIEECKCGLVCEPEDYEKVYENIKWFIENAESKEIVEMGKNNRKYLEENFANEKIIHKYADEILKI